LLAAAIRSSGQYDFETVELNDQVCELRFLRRQPDGTMQAMTPTERVTFQEAEAKGWTKTRKGENKDTWYKTPRNMLFARAMTNGRKFHCPDACSGLVTYTEDELDDGRVGWQRRPLIGVDAEYTVTPDAPTTAPGLPPAAPGTPTTVPGPPLTQPPIEPPGQPPLAISPPPGPPPTAEPPRYITDQQAAEIGALARAHSCVDKIPAMLARHNAKLLVKLQAGDYEAMRAAITGGEPRTAEQSERIDALCGQLDVGHEWFKTLIVSSFRKDDPSTLTRKECYELIRLLESSLAEKKGGRA
jgi:hypothetical protein